MSYIDNVKDNHGIVVFPITHERAVRDSNGTTLETKLGIQNTSILALKQQIDTLEADSTISGYIRVAGSSDPTLSYKTYASAATTKWDDIFYPCLIGTPLTGTSSIGKILHVLKKLGARTATAQDTGFTVGQAVWEDMDGTPHAIDGSEGDVMVTNIQPYHEISGQYTINGTDFDVFLRSLSAFKYYGIESREVEKRGDSPDYCVSHTDSDNVVRMHSVYNPAWNGSYSAQDGIVGAYIFSTDAETGDIVETYDASGKVLGSGGGLHSTDISLDNGEQRAMNLNADTTKTVPWFNHTARSAELLWANLAAEGGTFDSHKKELFGSGFSSNDPATTASDWDEDATAAKNGIRLVDKDGTYKMFSFDTDIKAWTGKTSTFYPFFFLNNSYRNPWKVMEAYRAVCHAIANDVPELTWFTFDGCKYKWRSVEGYDGPAQGEATCVVFKQISSKCAASVLDPTDKETSIEGHRVDFLISTGLYHGITTQVSPSWWTSGLIFTEDEDGQYECFFERDQANLIKSVSGDKLTSESWPFENEYVHVGTLQYGSGYRKNYSNDCLMLPDTESNKTGGGLHTYVGAYNYYSGTKAAEGKKSVRGFRRGINAAISNLSPLYVAAAYAPSIAYSYYAFGTCVRIVSDV